MKAVQVDDSGSSEGLYISEIEEPVALDNQVKIQVKAAGINRADTLQRMGKYPPPPGVSETIGLEVAGEIVELGNGVDRFKLGDRVMTLLAGGGYAELAVADQGSVLHIPDEMDFIDAAGIPEVFLTAYQAMFLLGNVKKGETILVHAGASGVGTAAIQLAKESGITTIVTAGSDEKISFCKDLGAHFGINYRTQPNFDELVREYTDKNGVDLIIDFVGADYLARNINSLALDGRMVILALLGGGIAEQGNLAQILQKRLTIMGSTLRSRTIDYKTDLVHRFEKDFLHMFENGSLKPVIDSVYSWSKVGEAHQRMENNLNMGKIILEID